METEEVIKGKNKIGSELKKIPNLRYHLFSMYLNFTTSPNSLKHNTSLYSVCGTFLLSYHNT